MKIITYLIIAILAISSVSALDLRDWPEEFAKNGWKVELDFVSGADAPTSDVLHAVDLVTRLEQWVSEENQNRPTNDQLVFNKKGGLSKTDNMEDLDENLVLIGRPCENKLVAEYLGSNDCSILEEGTGYLEIIEDEGMILILSGGDPAGIKKAKDVAYNFEDYSFGSAYYQITGSSPYTLIPLRPSAPEETEEETIEEEVEEVEEETVEEEIPEREECTGCMKTNVCFQTGDRDGTQYCSSDGEFKDQRADGEKCGINYQCTSNTCEKSECTSPEPEKQENFFEKIISWFKGLFG